MTTWMAHAKSSRTLGVKVIEIDLWTNQIANKLVIRRECKRPLISARLKNRKVLVEERFFVGTIRESVVVVNSSISVVVKVSYSSLPPDVHDFDHYSLFVQEMRITLKNAKTVNAHVLHDHPSRMFVYNQKNKVIVNNTKQNGTTIHRTNVAIGSTIQVVVEMEIISTIAKIVRVNALFRKFQHIPLAVVILMIRAVMVMVKVMLIQFMSRQQLLLLDNRMYHTFYQQAAVISTPKTVSMNMIADLVISMSYDGFTTEKMAFANSSTMAAVMVGYHEDYNSYLMKLFFRY